MNVASVRAAARDQLLQLMADHAGSPALDSAAIERHTLAWFVAGVFTLGDVAELAARLTEAGGPAGGRYQLRRVSYRLH